MIGEAPGARISPSRTFTTPAGIFTAIPAVTAAGPVFRVGGISYASAGRFQPPVDITGPAPGSQSGWPSPACPQRHRDSDDLLGRPTAGVEFDENCQRLSITVPSELRPGEHPPVMVWIHGGSYLTGGGDLPIHDPATLVAEQRVIVVTVTYRLGILGFLGGPGPRPANLGLLDILSALRWVQRNIAAFDGDPECVTLFGQSAGGDAIAHLMASRQASGLFRRAVIQSAPLGVRRRRTRMVAAMTQAAGEVAADAALDDVLTAQRAAVRATRRYGLRGLMPFGVQYGHDPLPPETEVEAAWRETSRTVDVLLGTTGKETSFFVPRVLPAGLLRPPLLGPLVGRVTLAYTTEVVYARPARRLARLLRRAGGHVSTYQMLWRPPGSPLGATHAVELPLLFQHPHAWHGAPIIGAATPEQVHHAGQVVRTAWARFARTGHPGPTDDAHILRTR